MAKAEIFARVGEDPTNLTKQGDALKMGIVNRTLHRLACTNIIPRRNKYNVISYLDFIVIDKILKKEQVSLPKLILRHMQFCVLNTGTGLPYPGIVKRILVNSNMYVVGEERGLSNLLNMTVYRKLNWRFDEKTGWSKAKAEMGESSNQRAEESELLRQVVGRLDNMEKMLEVALSKDSADRVNLATVVEKNSHVLYAVLASVKREKQAAALPPKEKEKEVRVEEALVVVPDVTLPFPLISLQPP